MIQSAPMTQKAPKAMILLSGGQDSTTCLAQALEDHPNAVRGICFDFGQRHKIEINSAKKIAEIANIPLEIVDLTFIPTLAQNALTNAEIPIEHKPGELPSTFVPGRNLFFLLTAAVKALQYDITTLYTGVCQTDYSGYPDCRDNFIKSAQQTISLALNNPIEIRTPLMWLTKAETVILMKKLGKSDWYAHSHTCYEGRQPACGKCPACILRLEGFKAANQQDPLPYA